MATIVTAISISTNPLLTRTRSRVAKASVSEWPSVNAVTSHSSLCQQDVVVAPEVGNVTNTEAEVREEL